MSTHPTSELHQPLANELLILVIHQCRGDQHTLYALTLVNTMFHAESQPLLYHQLTSSQPKNHAVFINIITIQKPHLITLITKYDSSNIDDLQLPLWTSMMDCIAQMDSLQELGLRIIDCDYHRAEHPFRPVTTGWNAAKLIPETPRFKLRSLRLRRKAVHNLGVGWWVDLIRAHADTLEYLDMSDIKGVTPLRVDEEISYPKLETVKGEWDVVVGLLPGKSLRVIDITDKIRRFNMSKILLEITSLEGFSSRYVSGMSKAKSKELLEVVSRLDSVKYLGVAQELNDLPCLAEMLTDLPPSGLQSLQVITLLWSSTWNEKYYHDIREAEFIQFFKLCPSLRFIDIELPPRMGVNAATKPYLASYYRIECRNVGQLHRYRFCSFLPDAIFKSERVSRARHTLFFK